MSSHFDFTTVQPKRRPSAPQIIHAWKKAGKPADFSVAWGETYAEFFFANGRWHDAGNGCRGVDRDAVVRALKACDIADPEREAQAAFAEKYPFTARDY